MGKKLYVGNLPYSATEDSLTETFSQCGNVESARIITDRDSGRSKGFGFVEMSSDEEAAAAINKLNGTDMGGRQLTVNEAKPQAPREGGRGGGGGGFGRGGGRW
jgi:RNA recognition motif-containing protein